MSGLRSFHRSFQAFQGVFGRASCSRDVRTASGPVQQPAEDDLGQQSIFDRSGLRITAEVQYILHCAATPNLTSFGHVLFDTGVAVLLRSAWARPKNVTATFMLSADRAETSSVASATVQLFIRQKWTL